MAKLRERLEAELGNWTTRLPDSWRERFSGVALDFASCDENAELGTHEAIWPQESAGGAPGAHLFKAHRDLAPERVRAVIFGNDPYTRICQATGRSFEQGDLGVWADDIRVPKRVSPSLQSVLCAAVATGPGVTKYALTDTRQSGVDGGGQPIWFCHTELARAFLDGAINPMRPSDIFGYWATQGVLWLNRTLTYTRWDNDARLGPHRGSHRRVWAPFTEQVLRILALEARERAIVVVMWGTSADDLLDRLKSIGNEVGAPHGNIRVAATGHPQRPEGYFGLGNPLIQINDQIGTVGPPIEWSAPA